MVRIVISRMLAVGTVLGLAGATASALGESTWVLDKSSGNQNAYIVSNDVWRFKFDYGRGALSTYQAGTGVLNLSNLYEDIHAVDSKFKFTQIAQQAINGKSGITKIVFPPKLTTLGWVALSSNPDLEEIVFNEGFTATGAASMSGNSKLRYAVLPDSFTSASSDLFKNCSALEYVVLSSNMTSCGANAFNGAYNLTNFTYRGYSGPCDNAWPPKCPVMQSNVAPSSKIKGTLDLTGVTTIGGQAFSNCDGITEVFATNVVVIGTGAFSGCDALKTFHSSDVLEVLGGESFNKCAVLETFEPMFPDTLTSLTYRCTFRESAKLKGKVTIRNPKMDWVAIQSFLGCSSLQDVDISGVKNFPTQEFQNCTSITNAVLSPELERAPASTFQGCSALVNCENAFPPCCTNVGESFFNGCSALTNAISFAGITSTNLNGYILVNCKKLASVTIPSNVTVYGRQFLDSCRPSLDIYFLGRAPVFADYRGIFPGSYNTPYVFHACPKLDPTGWANLIKEPSANDLKRTLPEGNILGVETAFGSYRCWIVKWHSPLLPYGLQLFVR